MIRDIKLLSMIQEIFIMAIFFQIPKCVFYFHPSEFYFHRLDNYLYYLCLSNSNIKAK